MAEGGNGCMTIYNEIQKEKKHRYAIFIINNGIIEVEKMGDKEATYETFLGDLQQKVDGRDDCRFAVYDYEYQYNPEGAGAQVKQKLFLLCWCPDTAAIKKKMLYASSFDTLKRAFVGVHKVLQINEEGDVQQEEIEKVLRSLDRE